MLTEIQVPYTGPLGLPASKLKYESPTCEALKQGLWRMGLLERKGDFDQQYNRRLEASLDRLDPGGQNGYGKGRWEAIRKAVVPKGKPHAGEPALDPYARKLIRDEARANGHPDDTGEVLVWKFITEWWTIAATVQSIWHYDDTYRPVPMTEVSVQPTHGGKSDCSSTVIIARRYAHYKSGKKLADPAKQNWTGFGNTDWYEDDWPKVGSPFEIGDLAHFHSSRHVIECIKAGTFLTAVWGSNGRDAGPEIIRLGSYSRFPSEYMFTVRPDLIIV